MASEILITEIREIHKAYTGTPVEELISNPDWGELNFDGAKDDLYRVFDTFDRLLDLPINFLKDQTIQSIINRARLLLKAINKIKGFDITSDGDARQKRDEIINDLKDKAHYFCEETGQWVAWLLDQEGNIQQNTNKLNSAINNANRMVADAKEEIQSKKDEIDEIVTAAKEASASIGVVKFAADFSSEISTLITSAKQWLKATVIFGTLTLIAAITFFFVTLDPKDGFAAAHLITTKLIILGLLFSATSWCGKIYKVIMHQITINKHRANAINTFQAFTKAASDNVARDAVLKETTKSIFDQRPTGYLDKEIDKSK